MEKVIFHYFVKKKKEERFNVFHSWIVEIL